MVPDREYERGRPVERLGNVVFGDDRRVAGWVARRIPGYIPTLKVRALGIVKAERLVAGIIFENWNGVHIEAAIAAESGVAWADRGTLHAMFFYPFVTLDCEAISVSVPSSNLTSLNLATKLGFTPEAIIALAAHDGSSLIILKMFRKNCKWIGDHGKEGRERTSGT